MIFNNIRSETFRDFIVTFTLQLLGAGLSFGIQILIARISTIDTFGQFNVIMSSVSILSIIVLMGTGQFMLRMTSVCWNKSLVELQNYFNNSIIFIFFNWLILTVLVISVFVVDIQGHFNIEGKVLWLVLILILFNSLVIILQNVSRGRNRLYESIWPLSVLKPVLVLISIWIAITFFNELRLHYLIFIQVLVFSIIGLGYFFSNYSLFDISNIKRVIQPRVVFKNGFDRGKGYFFNGAMQVLLKNLDLVLIGLVLSNNQAGIFASASKINLMIVFALGSLNVVFSSKIASHYHKAELNKLNSELRKMSVLIAIFSVIIMLFIVIFGKQILLSFGAEYVGAYNVLIILTLANLIEVLFGPTGVVMNMTGFQTLFSKIMTLMLIIYILLMPAAIYFFGLMGAAIVIVVITVIKNVMQGYFIYNKLKIESGIVGLLMSKLSKK